MGRDQPGLGRGDSPAGVDVPPEGLLPLYLPLAATISILGQPAHKHHRRSWMLTLLFLGLGISALSSERPISLLSVRLLLMLVAVLLYRHHSALWPRSGGASARTVSAPCAPLCRSPPMLRFHRLRPCWPAPSCFPRARSTTVTYGADAVAGQPALRSSSCCSRWPVSMGLPLLCPPYRTSWPGP